jgi:hypothetical protein
MTLHQNPNALRTRQARQCRDPDASCDSAEVCGASIEASIATEGGWTNAIDVNRCFRSNFTGVGRRDGLGGYRPYTSIEQFRREIGKYVDGNEVARLESYITLD